MKAKSSGPRLRGLAVTVTTALALIAGGAGVASAATTSASTPHAAASQAAATGTVAASVAYQGGASTGAPKSLPGPHQPVCAEDQDGAYWTNPVSGITYRCRWVNGLGWRWVPVVYGCPGAMPYARLQATPAC